MKDFDKKKIRIRNLILKFFTYQHDFLYNFNKLTNYKVMSTRVLYYIIDEKVIVIILFSRSKRNFQFDKI